MDFLFKDFIVTYSKFFTIPKNLQYSHSYFKWTDPYYSNFMIEMMKSLAPRTYKEGEIIFNELDDISEITFVETGSYYVGYEINKVKQMKLHFPPGNIIGGVNVIALKKSWHIYQCKF